MSKRAQGTIEYLIIIAIVMVIGLTVVGLMSGFLNSGSAISEKQSRIYWSTQPLSIMDGIVDVDGNAIFIVRNNEFEDKNFTTMIIDEVAFSIESGAGKKLASGDKYSATLTGLSACDADSQSYNIILSHTSAHGLDKNSDAHYYTVFCTPKLA